MNPSSLTAITCCRIPLLVQSRPVLGRQRNEGYAGIHGHPLRLQDVQWCRSSGNLAWARSHSRPNSEDARQTPDGRCSVLARRALPKRPRSRE